jgi:hypothetical protein
MAKKSLSKAARDNRANQLNPTRPACHRVRGATTKQTGTFATHAKPAVDGGANQLNPNQDAHQSARALSGQPEFGSNASSVKSERPTLTLVALASRGVGARASHWRQI